MANALRVSIVVIFCLIIGLTSILALVHADATTSNTGNFKDNSLFKDIETHWSKAYVKALVDKKVINGFPDGTFRPQATVTVAEFTKILVTTLGHQPNTVVGKKHWAQGYMEKALYEGLIMSTEKEFQALDKPMTRGQVARMIYRALPDPQEFNEMTYYQYMIKDLVNCEADDRIAILNCFRKGIITGYQDGSFNDKSNVSRAEATTMIMRYIDLSLRIIPRLPYAEGVTVTESNKDNEYDFYISFNITYDVTSQHESVRSVLNKYLDISIVNQILEYSLLKTNYRDLLKQKTFKSNGYIIEVLSSKGNSLINIRGSNNEK